ncbi:MAG: hypothetical protein EP347_08475 [Alphaproteobacteria bacterium]|nr:MAG: hypothetical protein EP347_08475 [Alphaproteobacteria bacterium]
MKFWSFFQKDPRKAAAAALHREIAGQSRLPVFFTDFEVADTIDGRFDLLVLHGFLVMHRLKQEGEKAKVLSQTLFDKLFEGMDVSLREMGVGDLIVGKRIRGMATAFYGRVDAYTVPLEAGDRDALVEAINRNLYRGQGNPEVVGKVADYAVKAASLLKEQSLTELAAGQVRFPDPEGQ